MKCEYCSKYEDHRFNEPVLDNALGKDYLYVDVVTDKLVVECELENMTLVMGVEINYCPICGKELLKDEI